MAKNFESAVAKKVLVKCEKEDKIHQVFERSRKKDELKQEVLH